MDTLSTTELLGNLGEFFGAIAVVITLFYLALQVKHSKESMNANMKLQRLQMRQRITEDSSSLTKQIASSDLLTSVFAKLVSTKEELTEKEKIALSMLLSANMRTFEGIHYQYKNGLFDEAEWLGESTGYYWFLQFPVTQTIWGRLQAQHSAEFVSMVNAKIDSTRS